MPRRRKAWLAGTAAVAILAGGGAAGAAASGVPVNPFGTSQVGTQADGRVLLPDNQWVEPYGQRTSFPTQPDGIAVSPDGSEVAVETGGTGGYQEVLILDAASGSILQTVPLTGALGVAAPVYSPDGTALYVGTSTAGGGSQTGTNQILKYAVGSDGQITNPTSPEALTLPGHLDFPYGLAVSSDGSTLYAALSASNELGVIDTATMQLVTKVPVGNAPQGVALVGDEAFVSNRGGRAPVAGDTTNDSDGTPLVSSPVTGASTTGTVSVVNLNTDTVTATVNVGLQPTSLTVHDGAVFVTNTNSDTVSVIDAASHRVTQTFNVEPLPGSTVGASPNSITFPDPSHLLVSVGRDNALAEFLYTGPYDPVQYEGLIPTDWYPNDVQYDAPLGKVFVSNQNGVGTDGAPNDVNLGATTGTVTSFSPPSNLELGNLTSQVFDNNGWSHLPASNAESHASDALPGGGLPAIPPKLGEASAIKHVFLIIKENWPYDGVLGDIGKGNSDPSIAYIGESGAPNEHALANTFTLFDNFYDAGMISPDGHQWIMQGDANDYIEQDASTTWGRSYPYPGGDALAYQRDGFLWNTVEAAGKTVRNYGELESLHTGTEGTTEQYWDDSQILQGLEPGPLPVPLDQYKSYSDIPSLNAITNHDYPLFDLSIPDQYRVDVWEQDFKKAEKTGYLPNLTIIQLPDDHGPLDEIADNDLALGRIVDEISHSRFWKSSAIFAMEDDTQAAFDHVDAHRAPLWIASPYANRGVINNDYYTQINVIKTIEQILGAQPMNQMDRAAVPMFSAFTNKPNFTPFDSVPNQVPLEFPSAGTSTASLKKAAPVPAADRAIAAAWNNWYHTQAWPKLAGAHAMADSVDPPQLSRYLWYTVKDWSEPYPGDKKILWPDQVPGRNLPTAMTGGD